MALQNKIIVDRQFSPTKNKKMSFEWSSFFKLNELESPFNNFNEAFKEHQSFCCCRISMYTAFHRNLDNQQSWDMDRDLYGH